MICNDGLQKSFGADGQVPWRTKEPSDVGVACSRRPGKLFVLWPFHVCSSSILHEYYIYIYIMISMGCSSFLDLGGSQVVTWENKLLQRLL